SWGVRPVGEPVPAGAAALTAGPPQFFWQWSPQQYEDVSLLYSLNEYADSSDRGPELCEVQHSESLVPGTRQLENVRLELRRGNGELLTVAATPLSMVYMSGIGYGPPWRHGVYQGENVAEDEVWDLG